MTTLCSYDLNGKKLSFANWISNLSPQETPFTSMTGKESIQQTMFQWQTDSLQRAGDNAQMEGETATEDYVNTTTLKSNITQILRKTVKVSDTATALANYGRGKELQYQMEKAGKEMKRDLEWAFLNNGGSKEEDAAAGTGRETAGFHALVAPFGTPCSETGAVVHKWTSTDDVIKEKDIFDLTYNLYIAGSKASIIMFHPKWASSFSSLQEVNDTGSATRQRIFENTPQFSVHVSTLVDPLGQEYKLLPNRWMPEDKIFFFQPSDWTQMVLRAPVRTKLAKDGSYEKWMLEMEVGLRHRHPYASGILEVKNLDKTHKKDDFLDGTASSVKASTTDNGSEIESQVDLTLQNGHQPVNMGEALKFKFKTAAGTDGVGVRVSILKDGVEVWGKQNKTATAIDCSATAAVVTAKATPADAGNYVLEVSRPDKGVYQTCGLDVTIVHSAGIVTKPTSA